MTKIIYLLLSLALLLSPAACTPNTVSTATPAPTSHVELDVFSGLPNPTWDLSAADTATLLGIISALHASPPVDLPTPLGYRGFVIAVDAPGSGSRATIRAYHGIVEYHGLETNYYSDPDKQVERWLLSTAQPHIDSELYNSLLQEIGEQ